MARDKIKFSFLPAALGVMDQRLGKEFPGPAGEISPYGPGVVSMAVVQDEDSRREIRSPSKASQLPLLEGKVWHLSTVCGWKWLPRLGLICCIFYSRNQTF